LRRGLDVRDWKSGCFCLEILISFAEMAEYEKKTLLDRARRAQKIVENPGKYKICEGCDSIVASKVNLCPNCHGYRFEEAEHLVVAQAKALGSREQQSVVSEDLL